MIFDPEKYNTMDYFQGDPVEVVHRCANKRNIEVMGVVCSWLAFGNRKLIHKKCEETWEMMEGKPFDYVMSEKWRKMSGDGGCYYRMLRKNDFAELMGRLKEVYEMHESLEDAVCEGLSGDYSTEELIGALCKTLRANGIPKDTKSACKRLALFLRWMVRDDGKVDFGIWKKIDKKKLLMPMDVHVVKVAREKGLLERTTVDMKAALALTEECRKYFPDDPVAMDFALFTPDIEGIEEAR